MADTSPALNRSCAAGNLLYATTNIYCLAVDLENKRLVEIPKDHLEQCFCKKLARITGMDVSFDHVYQKCALSANINHQILYTCPFGLSNIIVPVFEDGHLVAALQAGPVLTQDVDSYLRDHVLSRWKLSASGQRHLREELATYPSGDTNYMIAVSELMAALLRHDPSVPVTAPAPTQSVEVSTGNERTCSDLVNSILSFIAANYAEDITLTAVAKQAYVNPSHLSRVFNRNMNCNFRAYLNNVRLDKARDLLLGTDMSIAEISSQVGFADQSYFNKLFKQAEGMAPSQYRKRHERA